MITDANGSVLSAIGLVGSKEEPTSLGDGVYIFADNVLVELNTPPSTGLLQFLSRLHKTFNLAAAHLAPKKLLAKAALNFPPEELQSPEAFMFGCTPEYCAWEVMDGLVCRVAAPIIQFGNNFRSCGGHIHIGCEAALKHPIELVRALDFYVGVPSVMMDRDSSSAARRSIYGGAGYFRPTAYGLEYRTLSNFWLASPAHASVIYRLVQFAVRNHLQSANDNVYREVIDGNHRPAAWTLWEDEIAPILMEDGAFTLIGEVRRLSRSVAPNFYESWGLDKAVEQVLAEAT